MTMVGVAMVALPGTRMEGQGRPAPSTQAAPTHFTAAVDQVYVGAGEGFSYEIAQQDPAGVPPGPGKRLRAIDAMPMMPMPGPFEMDLKPITGAPYAAEAVTEVTQTLADGNRIIRKVTASVARDSQGRTRREMTLAAVGPWMPDDPPRTVFIHDPVAHFIYVLDMTRQTAMKRPLPDGDMMFTTSAVGPGVAGAVGSGVVGGVTTLSSAGPAVAFESGTMSVAAPMTAAVAVASESGMVDRMQMARARMKGLGDPSFTIVSNGILEASSDDAVHESLGTQQIEGVEATGSKTTVTIPAGQIGNELPIRIVSERWYSAALQTVVLSKRDDPRFGETVYRLTGINRAEPAVSLFEVPAGFTVTDEPDHVRRFKMMPAPPPPPVR
jgi:hypothetical protein